MTNKEIIKKYAIEHNLLGENTEEKIQLYESTEIDFPIKSRKNWKDENYIVKEEELDNPCAVIPLWFTYWDKNTRKRVFKTRNTKLYLISQCEKLKKEEG